MKIYIPDVDALFDWLTSSGYRYAVLRSFIGLENGYPRAGGKRDIDILVDDIAIGPLRVKYGHVRKTQGVKCDFYHACASHDGSYLGESDFPPALAELILSQRQLWHSRFFVPAPEQHYLSLLYTLAYHKSELTGFTARGMEKESKYTPELEMLEKTLGLPPRRSLFAFHAYLSNAGYAASYSRLARNIQNNHARGRFSNFLQNLCEENYQNTLGLFVIGRAFSGYKKLDYILAHIRKVYQVLEVKPLSRTQRLRLFLSKTPAPYRHAHTVVVVLQKKEAPTPPDFSHSMQSFLAQAVWRSPRIWPISAAKNESDALAHLPLFFSEIERHALYKKRTRE